MKLSDFNLFEDDNEKDQLLSDLQSFNQTDCDFPRDVTLHALFSLQAYKTPDAPALISDGVTLSYWELEQQSNQLARFLIAQGIHAEESVAVMLEPSSSWIIAVMGIFKAGACYVPIDRNIPIARIEYMLINNKARCLISSTQQTERIAELTAIYPDLTTLVALDNPETPPGFTVYRAGDYSSEALAEQGKPGNLAYIIYTSGSGGRPKGVMIEHWSLVNLMNWHRRFFDISSGKRSALFSNIAFDASILESFPHLLTGGCIYPLSDEVRLDIERLIDFLALHAIQYIFVTPLVCQEINRLHRGRLNKNLLIITGGETLKTIAEDELNIVNIYGTTECTVFNTLSPVVAGVTPDIGKPIDNTRIYITDTRRQLVPVGVPGEICIGGVGVARGYLNDAELSLAKFIDNPFEPGQRIYCTGDLGRWRPDGNLEFLGRIDNQIKIRGFRIEPGEVENTLLTYPSVLSAVVTARELSENNRALLAYVTVAKTIDTEVLRNYLKGHLPDFMVPAHIMILPQLPLTANGKTDFNALPLPTEINDTAAKPFVAPTNETEQILQRIWENVLGIAPISVTDNFFELGGHSIKVTGIIAGIRTQLHVEQRIAALFKAPTIRQLAELILDNTTFNSKEADEPMLLLNGVTDGDKVFAFPPGTGDAIGFSQLAHYFKHTGFYSFNFLEIDTRIKDYADLIMATDTTGPYRLLGYSAGGNLAYHVAYELEQRGKQVSDIIMIDSAQLNEVLNYPQAEVQKTIAQYINHDSMKPYLHNSVLRDKAARLIQRYHDYLSKTVDDCRVNANIHVLLSENSSEVYYSDNPEIKPLLINTGNTAKRVVASVSGWQNLTLGTFKTYQGSGSHNLLLIEPYLKGNAEIVQKIIGF